MRHAVVTLALLLCACQPQAPAASAPPGDAPTGRACSERESAWPIAVTSKDGLRALGTMRPGPEWRHFGYRGLEVAAAAEVLPTDGESYIDVYGYAYNHHFR